MKVKTNLRAGSGANAGGVNAGGVNSGGANAGGAGGGHGVDNTQTSTVVISYIPPTTTTRCVGI